MNILGIDYGDRYMGIAISKNGLVTPLKNFPFRNNHPLEEDFVSKIKDIIIEEKIDLLLMGISGNTKNDLRIKKFGNKIKGMSKLEYINEYKTTKIGIKKAVIMGISRKSRKNDHMYAACEIINRYLEK